MAALTTKAELHFCNRGCIARKAPWICSLTWCGEWLPTPGIHLHACSNPRVLRPAVPCACDNFPPGPHSVWWLLLWFGSQLKSHILRASQGAFPVPESLMSVRVCARGHPTRPLPPVLPPIAPLCFVQSSSQIWNYTVYVFPPLAPSPDPGTCSFYKTGDLVCLSPSCHWGWRALVTVCFDRTH